MYQKENWQEHWSKQELPWKSSQSDQSFIDAFAALAQRCSLPSPARVFIPLCGDTEVVPALWGKGSQVTALDFIPDAICKLANDFSRVTGVSLEATSEGFVGTRLHLLIKDIFETSFVSAFDAVYDRAALVALPPDERKIYSQLIYSSLAPGGILYLVTNEFDDSLVTRPPYSVSRGEIAELYGELEELSFEKRKQEVVPLRLAAAGVTELTTFTNILTKKR